MVSPATHTNPPHGPLAPHLGRIGLIGRGSRSAWQRLPHPLRWIAVAIVGSAVLLTGLVLLILPGPGIPLIILGLLILATEFAWAERTLRQVQRRSAAALSTITRRKRRREASS